MKKKIIGYTGGIFDLFHIGHLNIIKSAKALCDELIVWTCDDAFSLKYKWKLPVFPLAERVALLESLKYVEKVVVEDELWVLEVHKRYPFDIIFKGDDWKGTAKWNELEKEFEKLWVQVVYFPYTESTSSTLVRKFLEEK